MTEFLRHELLESGIDPEKFIEEFIDWKSRGPEGEDDHRYFGKDGEYGQPTVNRKRVLRHVHLEPEYESPDFAAWDRAWKRESGRRTSDTALVYANGGRHGYLLLTILWEPTAHSVASMATIETRELMNNLAHVADQFIFDGTYEGI
jgi:hypothetical protein